MPIDYLEKERLRQEDIINTIATQLLVCICADASYSMKQNHRIDHLNNSINKFIDDVSQNIYACDTVDLCVVSFYGNKVTINIPFCNVKKAKHINLRPNGGTPLGKAVKECLRLIQDERRKWGDAGIQLYKSWLIIMTDDEAEDDIESAVHETQDMIKENILKTACLDLGDGNGEGDLKRFSMDGKVKSYSALNINNFFDALSKSATGLSKAAPDEDIKKEIL